MNKIVRNVLIVIAVVTAIAGVVSIGFFGYLRGGSGGKMDDGSFYDWEGEYVDTNGYMTSMSIKKGSRSGFYDVSICMGETNSTDLIFWLFTATYDKDNDILAYNDAIRRDWITLEGVAEESAEGSAEEGTEGTAEGSAEEGTEGTAEGAAEEGAGDTAEGSAEEGASEGATEDGELVVNEVYTDGSGSLAVSNGTVIWTDSKEDFGKNMVFEKSVSDK